MSTRHSLIGRSIGTRVSWGLIAFGTLTAFGLAGVAIFFNEQLEKSIMTTAIEAQISHVAVIGKQSGGPERIVEDAYQAYFVPKEIPPEQSVPAWIVAGHLSGKEDIQHDDRMYEISQRHVAGGQVFVATDVTSIEVSEASFMYAVLVCAIAFALFCVYLARRVSESLLRPLSVLADEVAKLEPSRRGERLHAVDDASSLEQISTRFNEYLAELDAFVTREQHLTAMASHELRTPIAIIRGAVDVMLEREGIDAANTKTLGRMREATSRMAGSVDALLQLSRMRDAPIEAFPMVDVCETAREVVESMQAQAVKQQTQLGCGDLEALRVQCHQLLLEILIRNLVTNAIKFAPNGRVEVCVTSTVLQVKDSGQGGLSVSMDQLLAPQKLSASANGDGFGLGLYIVAEVCRRFDWQVTLAPGEQCGTVATVMFREPSVR